MPWRVEKRDGRYCVIKESDGSSAGCHDSRTDAIKQQRALYANESRMASMYAELDEITEEYVEAEVAVPVEEVKPSELVKIEIGKENQALTAALMERMEQMDLRAAETQQALVAALHAIGLRNPVVNVEAAPAPNVTVEAAPPAEVKVDVHVPEQEPAKINFSPEIVVPQAPPVSKTVTFERDPLTGQVTKADVTEV